MIAPPAASASRSTPLRRAHPDIAQAHAHRGQRSARLQDRPRDAVRNRTARLRSVPGSAGNASVPSRKLATATSLAALSTAGAVPPARSASYARRRQGKRVASGARNASAPMRGKVERSRTPASMRSGNASACAIGVRMSGLPSCAMHRAVDVFDQRMDHALRDGSRPRSAPAASNSQCASITSRPLFIMVAESTEILRPITQFGCAQACSGVTCASRSSAACGTGRRRR